MSESEIRAELKKLIADNKDVERIMSMIAAYAYEYASDYASDAVREYEERRDF